MLTPEKRGPGPGKGGGKDNHCPVLSCTVINSFWISHELSWSRGRIYFNICPNQSHHLASPSSETDRGALLAAPCSVGGSHHEAESTGLWPCRGKVVFGSTALGDPLLPVSPACCSVPGGSYSTQHPNKHSPYWLTPTGTLQLLPFVGAEGPPQWALSDTNWSAIIRLSLLVSRNPWTYRGASLPLGDFSCSPEVTAQGHTSSMVTSDWLHSGS